jgi:hypothetical protein
MVKPKSLTSVKLDDFDASGGGSGEAIKIDEELRR